MKYKSPLSKITMVHSVQNRKKRYKRMKTLKQRTKGLAKLASRQMKGTVEMMLPYVALGDLRRRWRQRETPVHPALLRKVCKFQRIKIPKDKSLRISGSDGSLLVYGVALNDQELVDGLYELIQEAPTLKHYVFKGKKRSKSKSWHWTGWAKYSLEPFMSREYLDAQEEADKFFKDHEEVFSRISSILGQCAPGVFKRFQTYPLPEGVRRLCGAWLDCAINKGGNLNRKYR